MEASLRAFFQGFDFGIENNQNGHSKTSENEIPKHLEREFKVVQLIDAYRKSGHLLQKQIRFVKEEHTVQILI